MDSLSVTYEEWNLVWIFFMPDVLKTIKKLFFLVLHYKM